MDRRSFTLLAAIVPCAAYLSIRGTDTAYRASHVTAFKTSLLDAGAPATSDGEADPRHAEFVQQITEKGERYYGRLGRPIQYVAIPARNTDKSDPLGANGLYAAIVTDDECAARTVLQDFMRDFARNSICVGGDLRALVEQNKCAKVA